ncbi:MAG: cell division topological specificity factor MinE [Clostridia bacterium]|nr:cell division topological specificity factor MinE [Clostridia bacterium]
MTLAEITSRRLEKVLNQDKKDAPTQILAMLESDIRTLLQNYFAIEDISVNLSVQNGKYILSTTLSATHLKTIGIVR